VAIWGKRVRAAFYRVWLPASFFWRPLRIGFAFYSHLSTVLDGRPLPLNPIENWFGKLERQVLTKASVKSVDELVTKLTGYIRYYNESLFKPVKWTFSGFDKDKELFNVSMSKT